MKGRQWTIPIAVLAIGLICISTILLIPPMRLICPTCFGMEKIAPHLYIEAQASVTQRDALLAAYRAATRRLIAFYGAPLQAAPKVSACVSWSCWERFGGKRPSGSAPIPKGMAYAGKWIRLSPAALVNKQTATIFLAHERSHAELQERIGIWASWWRLPAWFNEGLAVLISDDPRYSEALWTRAHEGMQDGPPVTSLVTNRAWLRAVRTRGDIYANAAHLVRLWFRHAGKTGLRRLIAGLREGKSFASLYLEIFLKQRT